MDAPKVVNYPAVYNLARVLARPQYIRTFYPDGSDSIHYPGQHGVRNGYPALKKRHGVFQTHAGPKHGKIREIRKAILDPQRYPLVFVVEATDGHVYWAKEILR